jgi:hypothetical protein
MTFSVWISINMVMFPERKIDGLLFEDLAGDLRAMKP